VSKRRAHLLTGEGHRMIRTLIVAAAMVTMLTGLAAAETKQVKQSYLSESLKIPNYKAAFADLFRGERNLPPWLLTYLK
jgi:hypothetical protein